MDRYLYFAVSVVVCEGMFFKHRPLICYIAECAQTCVQGNCVLDERSRHLNSVTYICEQDKCTEYGPCENGATCVVDGVGNPSCVCTACYTGEFCDTGVCRWLYVL